ncbi:putative transposase [Vibrio cholerae]|nr:putative transposase [Vibrio cholerae]
MYRVKQLLGGRLSLRNYNVQVGETYAMIKALNKLTGLGMLEIRITQLKVFWFSDRITQQSLGQAIPRSRTLLCLLPILI